MQNRNDEFFQFQLQDLENLSNYFSDDPSLEDIARITALNLKHLNENVPAENKLSQIVDNRVNSIYESGLLDLKLKKLLKEDEKDLKSTQKSILDNICNNFWTYLSVRGDGNCFYRSFIVSYILKISLIESCEYLTELIKIIQNLKEINYIQEQNKEEDFKEETFKSSVLSFESSNTLDEARENIISSNQKTFQKQTNYNLQTETTEPCIVEKISKNSTSNQSEEIKTIAISFLLQMLVNKKKQNHFSVANFLEFYNSNPQLDFSLIIVCKNLLLVEYENMKQDSDSKFFIDDSMTNEITNMLLIYGQSASDLVFSLAARAFKCKLQLQNIYYNDDTTLIHNLLTFGSKEIQENSNEKIGQELQINISVWYTGGHYDILFDQQFSQQHMYFCFDEPIILQKQQQNQKNIEYEDKIDDNLLKNESPINIKQSSFYEGKVDEQYNLNSEENLYQNNYNQNDLNDNLFLEDDDKYQSINKIIKKHVCFCCNSCQDVVLQLQNDLFICKSCYQNQYTIFRLEGPSNSMLTPLQIQQCFYELVKQNIAQSQCICCNQIQQQYYEFQKLHIIFTKQLQEMQIKNNLNQNQSDLHINQKESIDTINNQQKCQQEDSYNKNNTQNIEKTQQIKDSLNLNIDENNDQNVEENIDKLQDCLFCLNCLREKIFFQNQYHQQKDYQIYLESIQGEVDVCFKPSLNQYFIDFINEECLMKIQNIETQQFCQICYNELIQIKLQDDIAQSCNKDTVKICSQCLYNTNLLQLNSLYNQNNQQFFQIQYFLYHLQCQKINQDQCLACTQFQNIQTNEANQNQLNFFEFTFLDKQFNICLDCIFKISFANEQSVNVLIKDFPMPLKIFLGQKQVYHLLQFAYLQCKWCRKANLNNNQNMITIINSIQYSKQYDLLNYLFECYECQLFQQQQQEQQQQLDFQTQNINDLNYYENDYYLTSLVNQINRKRRRGSLDEIEKICISCKQQFFTYDYDLECEICKQDI
ncbi:hypothetical protein TTHERM_00933230 (macronuclear) [Tetrahymena thermophila SB210]|uniref:ubiquitinyl hydrolase 1 n=1 Tax=Tetrahymena thermophila (strain SB210) TaxID=312017 RepID=I7MGM2_TETTS|nr:hypothetical protein TTHERM_00933230 [Tetrahymena thermophila SB210]EAS01634.2 hypothetical protein TTHERM_00933230 [Tetrahymena thermophila SB210]|eukprot:XP_001021879.2 hypothetical protein TTHERM_00933230 [Tetrahymena thermophila SB210]